MKKEKIMKKVKLQKGVTLINKQNKDSDLILEHMTECNDIDINPGIETVIFGEFNAFYLMSDDQKSFPDVKEIHINSNVSSINISNCMFPNVRKITSDSPYFLSDSMLIKIPDDIADMILSGEISKEEAKKMQRCILQNSFCKTEEDIIDLYGIKEIQACAFKNCKTKNITNTESVTKCYHAFNEYPIIEDVIKNGITEDVIIGTILVCPYIKDDVDYYEFPDAKITAIDTWSYILHDRKPDVNVSKYKKFIVKNMSQLKALGNIRIPGLYIAEELQLDINGKIDFSLFNCTRLADFNKVEIIENNKYYSIEDNVVYSKDKKRLIKYLSLNNNTQFVIPNGVEEIEPDSFGVNQHLLKIQLPETLKSLKANTFTGCYKLKTIYIPESVEYIEDNCFSDIFQDIGCVRIKSRTLPKNLISSLTSIYCNNNNRTRIKEPYLAIHLIDKKDNPLANVSECHIIERLYISRKMSPGFLSEVNDYYNMHALDSKYIEETWKQCYDKNLKRVLAMRVFEYINNNNYEVNEYIKSNSYFVAFKLAKKYCDALKMSIYSNSTEGLQKSQKRLDIIINRMIKFIYSGLLSDNALQKISDLVASVSSIESVSEALKNASKYK